jgi:subtilisin family serine protease
MDNSQKRENQLNLAVDVTETTRQKTLDLNVGFNTEDKSWELIVKYTTDLKRVREELKVDVVELMNGYAVITIPESLLNQLSAYEEVEFIEKPKRLIFEVAEAKSVSCVTAVQSAQYNLFGEGVIVAIIDSGVDYAHPEVSTIYYQIWKKLY